MGFPDFKRFRVERAVFVAREHGDGQHIHRNIQVLFAGQEFEAEADRLFFEIVAERPVAEHFKESQVHGVADFVDVAGADALLEVGQAASGRVLRALQIGDQRVHPGGGEQTGRVVFWDDRRALDLLMAFAFEKFDIFAADVCFFHDFLLIS